MKSLFAKKSAKITPHCLPQRIKSMFIRIFFSNGAEGQRSDEKNSKNVEVIMQPPKHKF